MQAITILIRIERSERTTNGDGNDEILPRMSGTVPDITAGEILPVAFQAKKPAGPSTTSTSKGAMPARVMQHGGAFGGLDPRGAIRWMLEQFQGVAGRLDSLRRVLEKFLTPCDAEPGPLGNLDLARGDRRAGIRIVGQERRAVEVGVVEQRREVRGGGDAEARLDHAAGHDEHAVRAGGGDHLERLTQAAALGELDVDAVDRA